MAAAPLPCPSPASSRHCEEATILPPGQPSLWTRLRGTPEEALPPLPPQPLCVRDSDAWPEQL